MSDFDLNEDQADAVDKIHAWFEGWRAARHHDQVFIVFGYAGTGKTSLIKHVAAGLMGLLILYASYTGKAARVMRKKGLAGATTIHSLCFRPVQARENLIAELHEKLARLPEGSLERPGLEAKLEQLTNLLFVVNEQSTLMHADLLVVDEVSMVDEELWEVLKSFGVPILVLGDPAQLPPIEGDGVFTEAKPDVMLTRICRQDASSPIIQVAEMARSGVRIPFGWHGASVRKVPKVDHANGVHSIRDHLEYLLKAEQVIVGKNDTRRILNKLFRMRLGREHPEHPWLPTERDKVMIRRNRHEDGLLNGDFVTLGDAEWNPRQVWFSATVTTEDGRVLLGRRRVYAGRFMDHYEYVEKRESYDYFAMKGTILADFGYALTAHTSQGSEWDAVAVWEERLKGTVEDHRKWLYTAITRAARVLKIAG